MTNLKIKGILVRSLDKEYLDHPEWHEDITYPDLPSAFPDIQRRMSLGSDKILIEVVYEAEEVMKDSDMKIDIQESATFKKIKDCFCPLAKEHCTNGKIESRTNDECEFWNHDFRTGIGDCRIRLVLELLEKKLKVGGF